MDCIYIKGIKAYGYVGFFKEEQKLGQWFGVDLRLGIDLQPAAQNDDLTQTVNYADIVNQTQQHITSSTVALIETLASNILDDLLAIERVQSVNITLTKLAAPIPNFSGTVAVQMARSKP